uniref:Neurofilament heavy polypeptide-like n=1 Tax=Panagrellus redivivus TaxID=6233 RepID=A0A7E4UVP3_PANRE
MKPKRELRNSEVPAKSPSRPSKESTAKPKGREKEPPSGSSRSTSRHSVKEDGAMADEKKKLSREIIAPKPKGTIKRKHNKAK